MARCVALYDYIAQDSDELTIGKNETLSVINSHGFWWIVQDETGERGLVPSNYIMEVRHCQQPPPSFTSSPQPSFSMAATSGGRQEPEQQTDFVVPSQSSALAIAKFRYVPRREDELLLEKGDKVIILKKAGDGWWRGRKDHHVGWFPFNYVETGRPPRDPVDKPVSICGVVALHSFNSRLPEELSFNKGDRMDILDQPPDDPDWWKARRHDGVTGLIPGNYVKVIQDTAPVSGDNYYFNNINLVKGLKIYFPWSVTSEFMIMRLKLWETFFKVESIMKRNPQPPSLDNIKHVLSAYYSKLKVVKSKVAQCQDIHEILRLVRDNSPLDDISGLGFFINEFKLEEAKVVIKEYKEAVEKFKEEKLKLYLEKQLSLLKYERITIVIDKDANDFVLNDVQRLSSAVLPHHVRINVNVIRGVGGDNMWGIWKPKSFTGTFDDPSVQSKDIMFVTEVSAGTTESVSHSYQEEEEETKDEDQVMLLQEKVESIQKPLKEEEELHEKEEQFREQVIKKYEEELLQQKGELIQNEETIAKITERLEEITGDLKHKTEQYEELISELKSEIQKVKNENETFQKQRKALILENERLMTLLKDHNVPVEQKEETGILQETETVHTCTYISKGDISKLSVILEPVEDDWYHIGQCLEVKESVLTEIKEMTPVDLRLTHVLETWCHEKDRTITELKESLKRMDRDDILEGLHELPTGQYTMNNDEEYDINVKDLKEITTQIETENKEIQTTQTTLDKEIQFNYLVPSQDNLEGLSESQIAGKKLFLVQGDKPQLMNWEEYGLRIKVPEASLSASETVEVSVLALVGGHFKFPDNTRLVSAVYAISTSPLLKSLRIEMQHCIDLSDPSLSKYLKFAVAPVHTASLPYQFSIIEGGEFPAYQRYGSIERSKFCQLAIVGKEEEENGGGRNEERNGEEDGDSGDEGGKGKGGKTGGEGQGAGGQEGGAGGVAGRNEEEKDDENGTIALESCDQPNTSSTLIVSTHSTGIREATVYYGQVFYEKADKMRFAATKDLNALIKFIRKEYRQPEMGQAFKFQFDAPFGCVELVFGPQDKPMTGWTVSPEIEPCQVEERDLDDFGHNSATIRLVSIYADSSHPDTIHVLKYAIPLKGLRKPSRTININRSLKDILGPSLPVSAVPVVVTGDTNLGLCSLNALKKQQDKLTSLLSRSEPIFRDIAIACTSATIIHSTEYDKIFDVKTGQSLAERADTFINCIMSVVDVCPDQLEVFLNIVMNKGNIAFVRIAELISQCFNGEVPEQCCIKLNRQ